MSKLPVLTADQLPGALAQGVVLLDFGAPWCGPCKALEPLVVQLGEEMAGQLTVAKIDIDATPDLAVDYGVMSVPTLMLFKDGKKVASQSGALSADALRAFVAKAL